MAQNIANLAVGAKVKFGKYSVNGETAQPITWLVVDKTTGVTLLTEKIIDLLARDAKEENNANSGNYQSYGNAHYPVSNIDQWLNKDSAAGGWYVAAHTYDTPPTADRVDYSPYSQRPGFLNAFSEDEKRSLLETEQVYAQSTYAGDGVINITRKVFLPSLSQVGETPDVVAEGTKWAYFNGGSRACTITQQWYNNTTSGLKSVLPATDPWRWWLRSVDTDHPTTSYGIDKNGGRMYLSVPCYTAGIRPALTVSGEANVSDTTDSDGCYTMVFNLPPPQPISLNVPSTIYGGRATVISWSASTDPDLDAVTYELECSYNGGSFTSIYKGTAITYAHTPTFGETTVQYRVRAVDSKGNASAYTTSASRTMINNNPPAISGSDGSLGTKTGGFSVSYTVSDADSDTVTVTEAVDGVTIRSYVATLGSANSLSITDETFLKLTNGTHTATITAKDAYETVVRTHTFVKNATSFTVKNSTPMEASSMPTRISVSVTRSIPTGATFLVEVCNNGYDASPTWENATSAVTGSLTHVFSNKTKTASKWGVLVRVTVTRNNAQGACYISAIGGNFE